MTTNIKTEGNQTILELEGRLDTPSAPQVEVDVRPLMSENVKDLLVDCTNLSYISSSGLRILITLQKYFLKSGGKLTIKSLSPEIKEVFEMTGFTNIFTIID